MSEERKQEIRQALVEMARSRRHASAFAWISGLPIEEEEYARSIFSEVEREAAGGCMSGGSVPVAQVWDKASWPSLSNFDLSKIGEVRNAFERVAIAMEQSLAVLNKLQALSPPSARSIREIYDRLQDRKLFTMGIDGHWIEDAAGGVAGSSGDGEAK